MAIHTHRLRDGAELVIEMHVGIRHTTPPTSWEREDDYRAAEYTKEYMQVHIQEAFSSFNPITQEVIDKFFPRSC